MALSVYFKRYTQGVLCTDLSCVQTSLQNGLKALLKILRMQNNNLTFTVTLQTFVFVPKYLHFKYFYLVYLKYQN